LKLKIDVPENLMIEINRNQTTKRVLYAKFDRIRDVKFPLEFSEASTKADPNTRTFKITLKMKAPKKYNVLPGMTATVVVESSPDKSNASTSVAVPVSAVVANSDKQATVWIVDEETMTVTPKMVTPGLLIGGNMLVEGLSKGERIVVAGAAYLRNEMKVTLLETGEQPEQ
jgi:RND family efflux transporter MFP subunit